MSLFDGFFSKITSCFAHRKEDRNIANRIGRNNENYSSEEFDSSDSIIDNTHLYNFPKIYETLTYEGINIYKLKSIFSVNKVALVTFKFSIENNSIILKYNEGDKEKLIQVENIIQCVYGNFTSKFVLLSDKLDVVPWRCFSLIDKFYETYDFICENDDEIFYILVFLDILLDKEKYANIKRYAEGSDGVKPIVMKYFWKKIYLKVKK